MTVHFSICKTWKYLDFSYHLCKHWAKQHLTMVLQLLQSFFLVCSWEKENHIKRSCGCSWFFPARCETIQPHSHRGELSYKLWIQSCAVNHFITYQHNVLFCKAIYSTIQARTEKTHYYLAGEKHVLKHGSQDSFESCCSGGPLNVPGRCLMCIKKEVRSCL